MANSITLDKSSYSVGDTIKIHACSDVATKLYIYFPNGNSAGVSGYTIAVGTCVDDTVTTSVEGVWKVQLHDVSTGAVVAEATASVGVVLTSDSVTLGKTSSVPGESVSIHVCASNGYFDILNPNGSQFGRGTIPLGSCRDDSFAPTVEGTYKVRVLDNTSGAVTASATLQVGAIAQASLTIEKTTITLGESITFTGCAPNGTVQILYPSGAVFGNSVIPAGTCKNDYVVPDKEGIYTFNLIDNSSSTIIVTKTVTVSTVAPPPTPCPDLTSTLEIPS